MDFKVLYFVFCSSLAWLTATSVFAAENDRPVVDEAGKNPTFIDFRSEILAAFRLGDIDTIVNSASEDILLDFGGGSGKDEFKNRLTSTTQMEKTLTEGERYQSDLEEALLFGGRFTSSDVFEAPSSWSEPLPQNVDPFDLYFVLGSDIPVFSEPDANSTKNGTVSFELMMLNGTGGAGTLFLPVASEDGRVSGFVDASYLKSPLDYRAIFKMTAEGWKLTAFVAGD